MVLRLSFRAIPKMGPSGPSIVTFIPDSHFHTGANTRNGFSLLLGAYLVNALADHVVELVQLFQSEVVDVHRRA